MDEWTVGPLAELMARARPNFSASYFARQIRGWAQLDLFPDAHLRGAGRTAAQVFGKHHLVSVSIFNTLTSFGFTAAQLKIVQACFHNRTNISKVLASYNEGDRDWHLILYMSDDGAVCGGSFQKDVKVNAMMKATAPNIIVLAPRTIFAALDRLNSGEV